MKKILALLVAIIMIVSALAGCSIIGDDVGDADSSDTGNPSGDKSTDESNDHSGSSGANKNDNEENTDSDSVIHESEGLLFRLEEDHAVLIGRGSCSSENIVVPAYYADRPVTTVGESCFMNDYKLKSLVLPDTITTLEDSAIYGCPYLTNLDIPDTIVNFGRNLLWGCNALPHVMYENISYFGPESNPYMFLIVASYKAESYEVHKDTKYIKCDSFAQNEMKSITLPEGLLVIDSAFRQCKNLEKIEIPDSVTSIYSAFSECKSLKEVTLGKGLVNINEYAFLFIYPTFYFNGTEEEWALIAERTDWTNNVGEDVICTGTASEQ